MTETFFISDTHFGHKSIFIYEPDARPFKTIEEHDAELVKRWNSVVMPKDKVYHMGDFAFGKRNIEIAAQLNGNKVLVMGNHDMYNVDEYRKYFNHCFGVCEYKGMILTHVPVHPRELARRYYANIHGHLHSKTINEGNYLNVGCEQTNLTPIPLDEVYNRLAVIDKASKEKYKTL